MEIEVNTLNRKNSPTSNGRQADSALRSLGLRRDARYTRKRKARYIFVNTFTSANMSLPVQRLHANTWIVDFICYEVIISAVE